MYVARFTDGKGSWIQAIVRVRLFRADSATLSQWNVALEYAIRELNAIPAAFRARRFSARPAQSPDLLYMAMCPVEHEGDLRRAVGTFTRLDRHLPESVELPADADQFVAWQSDFPRLQGLIEIPRFRRGSLSLACPFRLSPVLPELIRRAQALEHAIVHQVHLQPWQASRETIRAAMLNCNALETAPGMPSALLSTQRAACTALRHAAALVEELVGTDTPEAAQWLKREVLESFKGRFAKQGFPAPDFDLTPLGCQEGLATGLCEDLAGVGDLGLIASTAVGTEECLSLLTYRSELLRYLPLAMAPAQPEDCRDQDFWATPAPSGSDVQRPYAFISYQHSDSADVVAMIKFLTEHGVRTWYDGGIPGGMEWDAVIEERIRNCNVLLLILSNSAVRSRYVRREVKYADTLGKPIVTVKLSAADLTAGMAMLLLQYQMIDLRSEGARDAVLRDVKRLMYLPQ